MLLAIAWLLLNKLPKYNNFFSGVLVGITASLRPPFLLFFIPFLVFQRYSFLLGGLVGLLLSLALSFSVVSLFIWKQYILAMLGMTGFVNLNEYLSLPQKAISNSKIIYPKIHEGFSVDSRNPLEYRNLFNTSIYDVLNALDVPNSREILVIGFIIAIAFLIFYLIKYNSRIKDIKFMFLFGTLICLIGEFFIPIGRYSYYDIQFMLPLLIIINKANVIELISNKLIILLLIGLLLSLGCFVWIDKFLFFSSYLIAFYTTVTSLILLRQEAQQ